MTPKLTELEISSIGKRQGTSKGNFWIECATGHGLVAFWGKSGNMANIERIEAMTPPFKATCGCIPSNWAQHKLWIPETSAIKIA